eukprot:612423-Pleurochrysis_carterae.AAC.1
MAAGHVCAWITEGLVKPAFAMASMMGAGRFASAKDRNGGGEPPYTLSSFFRQNSATASLAGGSTPWSCTSL